MLKEGNSTIPENYIIHQTEIPKFPVKKHALNSYEMTLTLMDTNLDDPDWISYKEM